MKRFILNISHHLFPILFIIYYKTQQIDGLFYIHIEPPISVYLECKVDMEFN